MRVGEPSAVSASCAIPAMMRFSAAGSSGRLSGAIGTPAVDQIHSGIGPQPIAESICRSLMPGQLSRPALSAAASASRSPRAASKVVPGSALTSSEVPPSRRRVEQVGSSFLLRVVGVLDLEPPDTGLVGVGKALRDNAFEVMGAHQMKEFSPSPLD
jgi:hypothetical protein